MNLFPGRTICKPLLIVTVTACCTLQKMPQAARDAKEEALEAFDRIITMLERQDQLLRSDNRTYSSGSSGPCENCGKGKQDHLASGALAFCSAAANEVCQTFHCCELTAQ